MLLEFSDSSGANPCPATTRSNHTALSFGATRGDPMASEMGAAEATELLDGNPFGEGVGLTVGLLNTDLSVPLSLGVDGKKGVPEGTGVIEGD